MVFKPLKRQADIAATQTEQQAARRQQLNQQRRQRQRYFYLYQHQRQLQRRQQPSFNQWQTHHWQRRQPVAT